MVTLLCFMAIVLIATLAIGIIFGLVAVSPYLTMIILLVLLDVAVFKIIMERKKK